MKPIPIAYSCIVNKYVEKNRTKFGKARAFSNIFFGKKIKKKKK